MPSWLWDMLIWYELVVLSYAELNSSDELSLTLPEELLHFQYLHHPSCNIDEMFRKIYILIWRPKNDFNTQMILCWDITTILTLQWNMFLCDLDTFDKLFCGWSDTLKILSLAMYLCFLSPKKLQGGLKIYEPYSKTLCLHPLLSTPWYLWLSLFQRHCPWNIIHGNYHLQI